MPPPAGPGGQLAESAPSSGGTTAGGTGFQVTINSDIATSAQAITVTYQATVSSAATPGEVITPKAEAISTTEKR